MINISTHILNTSTGKPAQAVAVYLYYASTEDWIEVSRSVTNKDGRIGGFELNDDTLEPGMYKLRFETNSYFAEAGISSFYPFVEIVFTAMAGEHYHVPLLLNPFGYTTYRGS